MSLNRCEHDLLDYVQRNPDERHYWEHKVRRLIGEQPDGHAVATSLEGELRRYLEERAGVLARFREYAVVPGGRRTSLRNLADFLIRMWSPPKPAKAAKKPKTDGGGLNT